MANHQFFIVLTLLLASIFALALVSAQNLFTARTESMLRTTSRPNSGDVTLRQAFDSQGNLYQTGFLNFDASVNLTDVQVFNRSTASYAAGSLIFTQSAGATGARGNTIFISKTNVLTGRVQWMVTLPTNSPSDSESFASLTVAEARQRIYVVSDWTGALVLPASAGGTRTSAARDNLVVLSLDMNTGSIVWATTSRSANTASQIAGYDIQLGCDNGTLYITGPMNGTNIELGGSVGTISATSPIRSAYILTVDAATGAPQRVLVSSAAVDASGETLRLDCAHSLLYVDVDFNSHGPASGPFPAVFGSARVQQHTGTALYQFTVPGLTAIRALSFGATFVTGWQLKLVGNLQILVGGYVGNVSANVLCPNFTVPNVGGSDAFVAVSSLPTDTSSTSPLASEWIAIFTAGSTGDDVAQDVSLEPTNSNAVIFVSGYFSGHVELSLNPSLTVDLVNRTNPESAPDGFVAVFELDLATANVCTSVTPLGAVAMGSEGPDQAVSLAVVPLPNRSYAVYPGGEMVGPTVVFPGNLTVAATDDAFSAQILFTLQ